MKITNLFFAFYLVVSRSIFPKPRPTTLGYHPDHPNILIPVPLFPIGPATEDETDLELSRENISETTTTFESTTSDLTTEKALLLKGSPEGSSDQKFRGSILCDVIESS